MRTQSHRWDNRQERRIKGRYNGWTRRLTWYCASLEGARDKDIRIKFEDETGSANRFYNDDKESAEQDWKDFKSGALTVVMILKLTLTD